MESSNEDTIVLSVDEISENADYVLVKFIEVVNNCIVETYAKGIKDESGDIVKFINIK